MQDVMADIRSCSIGTSAIHGGRMPRVHWMYRSDASECGEFQDVMQ